MNEKVDFKGINDYTQMKNKYSWIVPKGVRYLGNWDEFDIPDYKAIIDKKMPGCGFTRWCLEVKNRKNIILCSPRKILLQNKHEQHPNTFLVKNDMDKDTRIDKDTNKIIAPKQEEEKSYTEKFLLNLENNSNSEIEKLFNDIWSYLDYCIANNLPAKIMVTYDSYHIVKDTLKKYTLSNGISVFNTFYTVVDEFQSIFIDSSFKPDTELSFMNCLDDVDKVCFVSATPMLESYLCYLDQFKNLPYIELDWKTADTLRIIQPVLETKTFRSLNGTIKKIVDSYLNGNFRELPLLDENGKLKKIIESKEAVFYVNSVKNIISIIKNCKLNPDQVNILCSKNDYNENRIKTGLGGDFKIGRVPLENEPNKMFTFCTRTVYLGADFYSTCARSFIFSDANMKTLKVDISLDLPQILGRQRNRENPWNNRAEFYFKTTSDFRKVSWEAFEKELLEKEERTNNLLLAHDNQQNVRVKFDLAKTYQDMAKVFNYKDNYVSVNIRDGKVPVPVFNKLVQLAEIRAFQIQQQDYASRVDVFNSVNEVLGTNSILNGGKIRYILRKLETYTTIPLKLKFLAGFESELSIDELNYIVSCVDESLVEYIAILGLSGCRACGYKISDMKKECSKYLFNTKSLVGIIYHNFNEGDKLTLTDIKSRLETIYKSIQYEATPKATDLLDYFEVKECLISIISEKDRKKKRVRGYELLTKKL